MRMPSPLLALVIGLAQASAQEPITIPAASNGLGTDPTFPLAVSDFGLTVLTAMGGDE